MTASTAASPLCCDLPELRRLLNRGWVPRVEGCASLREVLVRDNALVCRLVVFPPPSPARTITDAAGKPVGNVRTMPAPVAFERVVSTPRVATEGGAMVDRQMLERWNEGCVLATADMVVEARGLCWEHEDCLADRGLAAACLANRNA